MKKGKVIRYRNFINKVIKNLEDSDALDVLDLFESWKSAITYSIDSRVRYQEKLYKCIQAHTSQEDWTPDITPALWKEISIEEWPEWVQPLGAQDAYNTGDKVSHNEKHWISNVDTNVWEPGVYGWTESI